MYLDESTIFIPRPLFLLHCPDNSNALRLCIMCRMYCNDCDQSRISLRLSIGIGYCMFDMGLKNRIYLQNLYHIHN